MNMIQLVLILLGVGGAVTYLSVLRSKLLDRLVVVAILIVACILVAAPGLATGIAHWMGVGRGVDLVFYLAFAFIGFVAMLLASEIREVEAKLTHLTREVALLSTKMPCSVEHGDRTDPGI